MKKIFSILLFFILLASHMYLTIGTHFCSGEAVETKIMLGETHLSCSMLDMKESCNDYEHANNNQVSFNNTPCCQNEFQTIQGTDDFIKDASQIIFNVDFSIAFIYTILNFDLFPGSNNSLYTEYISPPFEKDIQVLFQTFLI